MGHGQGEAGTEGAATQMIVVVGNGMASARLCERLANGSSSPHAPAALVWGLLPGPRMWLWARKGHLTEGNPAPDFTCFAAISQLSTTLASARTAAGS